MDSDEDAEQLLEAVRGWFAEHTLLRVYNDAAIALCAGSGGELNGCVVVAGTGKRGHGQEGCAGG